MTTNVVLFVDYQNGYHGARRAFFPLGARSSSGQFNPLALGELLVERSPFERQLKQVRIYRGQPDATRDPHAYAANERQKARWAHAQVEVIQRTLMYPPGWPTSNRPGERPREKGIDVALALDFVTMAVSGSYDVGIILSTDTDMKPALEFVASMSSAASPRAEVAAWSTQEGHNSRLAVPARRLWCHWLSREDYLAVWDRTDYTRP
jgi:uncharacterized LabA/DUF88 family protein